MKFKDKKIQDIIDRLKIHYQLFINNQFIKYYLYDSNIPKNDWLDIEDLIDANKYYDAEGYDLRKLYDQLLTFSSFLLKIKNEILPRIKSEAAFRIRKMSQNNKILYEMTLDNLPENLKIFHDILIELFINVKKADRKLNGENNMLYPKLPYMREI
jgi:hypothetical protein